MRLRVARRWWQRRIRAAEEARQVAAVRPLARPHGGDVKVGHCEVAGLDVNEQRR